MAAKILLVAKPWRGGLASYVYQALCDLFPGGVEWLPTRPVGLQEQMAYRRDRLGWQERLLRRITGADQSAVLFINHLPIFEQLPQRTNHVLWLTDGPEYSPGELSPYGKVCLSDSGYAENISRVVGDRYAGEVGFGFLPGLHKPSANSSPIRDVCFIGNRDSKRDAYIEALVASETSSTIIGNYFMHHPLFWRHPGCFRPSIANEKMGKVYARHKLSLNVHARVVRCGTNMRTFECAGYGIPQLVEYLPGLEAYFEPGEEIATFTTIEEFRAQADRMLGDASYAQSLSTRAGKRARQHHSYQQRCAALLSGVLPV